VIYINNNNNYYKELYEEYKRLNTYIIVLKSKITTSENIRSTAIYEKKLRAYEKAYNKFKNRIRDLKSNLRDDLELEVFDKRFIRNWSIKRVANYLNYSEPRIKQVIKNIKEMMEKK